MFFLPFQIHLQMSPTQLQQVFHVDEVNQVPNYELIKLTHLSTAHHVRKKRSIDTASNSLSSSGNKISNNKNSLVNNHHVKKDLSKVPIDEKLNSIFGAEIKREKIYDKTSYNKNEFGKLPTSTSTTEKITIDDQNFVQNEKVKISDLINLSDIKEHKVSFDAFGETLNLTLRPTEGLFKEGPQSLKMWHAHPDPNATDGINYEEVGQVRNFFFFTLTFIYVAKIINYILGNVLRLIHNSQYRNGFLGYQLLSPGVKMNEKSCHLEKMRSTLV